jgi:UTP-glucose-1-phosphate uridylyltransferase
MGRVTASASGGDRPALVMLAAGMAKRYGGCKPLAPVGLHGEAVIDLIAGDALAAGFGPIVLVLGPRTGPAIAYHVRQCFPARVDVAFAEQRVPLGTAHAVLCARKQVGDGPFAVANADDVYGAPAMRQLAGQLAERDKHAIVSYRLDDTVVTDAPVTRGTCEVGRDGNLVRMVERRAVARRPDGSFDIGDGLDPSKLSGDTPVSMNLWGFQPSIWPVLEAAVLATHPSVSPDGGVPDPEHLTNHAEVLLPEVVGDMIAGQTAGGDKGTVRVIAGEGRCLGVTHAEDLPVVRNELALLVAQGRRPEGPWDATV